jgi:hypothetical protein
MGIRLLFYLWIQSKFHNLAVCLLTTVHGKLNLANYTCYEFVVFQNPFKKAKFVEPLWLAGWQNWSARISINTNNLLVVNQNKKFDSVITCITIFFFVYIFIQKVKWGVIIYLKWILRKQRTLCQYCHQISYCQNATLCCLSFTWTLHTDFMTNSLQYGIFTHLWLSKKSEPTYLLMASQKRILFYSIAVYIKS